MRDFGAYDQLLQLPNWDERAFRVVDDQSYYVCGSVNAPTALGLGYSTEEPLSKRALERPRAMEGIPENAEKDGDNKLYAAFEDYEEFVATRDRFLAVDLYSEATGDEDRAEALLLRKQTLIVGFIATVTVSIVKLPFAQFDKYQEQPYLLDPYLEQLFAPVVETLKAHAKKFVSSSTVPVVQMRLHRLSLLLYTFIKFRGYKTISTSNAGQKRSVTLNIF